MNTFVPWKYSDNLHWSFFKYSVTDDTQHFLSIRIFGNKNEELKNCLWRQKMSVSSTYIPTNYTLKVRNRWLFDGKPYAPFFWVKLNYRDCFLPWRLWIWGNNFGIQLIFVPSKTPSWKICIFCIVILIQTEWKP